MITDDKIAAQTISHCDPVWRRLRIEADKIVAKEPELNGFIYMAVLCHDKLEDAVICRLSQRLAHPVMPAEHLISIFNSILIEEPDLGGAFRSDIMAVYDRDPACDRYIDPLLYFKGFHAIQTHRLAHVLWKQGREDLALYLQSRSSEIFQTDIHPAVVIGRGIFIDHATGVVIGGTAVIEDNVSILQNVTLGGTGKADGRRHPTIREGALIGAGAKVLGNIEVGEQSRIAAGSVVLKSVLPKTTVAGVPAKIVGKITETAPSSNMDQILDD